MIKYKSIAILGIMFFILTSCEKVLKVYLGFPMQPKNIDAVYEPGINIFGMLKAGPVYDTLNHYFEVQQIRQFTDTTGIYTIDSALIEITRLNDKIPHKNFILECYGPGRYTNPYMEFNFGEEWSYQCIYDTVVITSKTCIPKQAVIIENSLNISETELAFTIKSDNTAFMYDVYYVDDVDFVSKRIVPVMGEDTKVLLNVNYNSNGELHKLFVLAYDENYEKYVTTSNIFFKPNAFRPRFTTVDGGFGCFCSMSSLMVDL